MAITKEIKDFALKVGVNGTEDLLIQDNGVTKRIKASELMDNNIDLSGYYTKDEVNTLLANLDVDIDFSDYYDRASIDSLLASKANAVHTHTITDITDLELPKVPTKTSDLVNDSGFITTIPSEYVTETELLEKDYATETFVVNKIAEAQLAGGDIDLSGYATKDELDAKSDKSHNHDSIYSKLKHIHSAEEVTFLDGQTFQEKLDNGSLQGPKGDTGEVGPQGLQGLKGDKGDPGTTTWEGITNKPTNLATESFVVQKIAEASLSGGEVDLSGYATREELNSKVNVSDLSSVATSGNYQDLINKPTIPTVDVTKEYVDTQLLTKANVSDIPSLDGYATETFVTDKIAEASLAGGEVDLSGYATIDFVTQEINSIELTPGPKGDKGDTGPQGPQGLQGPKGDKGDPGTTSWNDLQDKPNIPSIEGLATTEYVDREVEKTNAQLSRNGYVYPEEFGAVGDGETDDTQSIQSAIDYCKMNDKTLKLVSGNVYIISSLTGYCGMRLYGNGGTLKLISNSPKYRLMLTIGESSDDDRNLTSTIRDVIFDGNCFNQGDFDNYEKEQQIGIMVSHTNYQNDENKTKVNISNCQFNNFCGDGTHVFVNSIVNFSNIIAQDCFRGGIVASGAWSHINIDNFQCHSTFGKSIDVEIDSREADEEYICVNLNNVNTNVRLDLQLTDGCKSELSTINASNLICTGPLLLGSSYGQTKISNSTLSSVKCENCKDVTFDNVTFLANLSSDADCLVLVKLYDYLITNEGANKNDFVATFNNCKFKRIDGNNYVLDKYISCYRQSINIANTYFLNGANIGVYLWVCAKNKLENTFFNTAQGVVLKDSSWDRMTRNELLNLSFGDLVEKEIRLIEDSNTQTVLSGVVEKASDFRVFGDTKYADFSNCYSNRILISDIDPTTEATPGYVGDRIRSKKYYTNRKEYICTKSSNENATWIEV